MSEETTNATLNTDNSEEVTQEQISQALDEPETVAQTTEETTEEQEPNVTKEEPKDNTVECPEKFRNEDGSTNVEKVLKSYKELEPLINEKAAWTKERAELLKAKEQLDEINRIGETKAREAGYDSAQDMQEMYYLAQFTANEYAKYAEYTEDPEYVRDLLIRYANNPSEDLMSDIEMEFAPSINKQVAISTYGEEQKFQQQKAQNLSIAKMNSIENIISKCVDKNKELFQYEPFKNMFINTLDKYGENFTYEDAEILMDTMVQMKDLFKAEFEKQSGIKLQNNAATDKLAALSNVNSAPAASQTLSNSDIENLSEKELAKEIRKYI